MKLLIQLRILSLLSCVMAFLLLAAPAWSGPVTPAEYQLMSYVYVSTSLNTGYTKVLLDTYNGQIAKVFPIDYTNSNGLQAVGQALVAGEPKPATDTHLTVNMEDMNGYYYRVGMSSRIDGYFRLDYHGAGLRPNAPLRFNYSWSKSYDIQSGDVAQISLYSYVEVAGGINVNNTLSYPGTQRSAEASGSKDFWYLDHWVGDVPFVFESIASVIMKPNTLAQVELQDVTDPWISFQPGYEYMANDFTISFSPNLPTAPVPIPSAVLLLGSGLLGLAGWRRFRKS